MRSPRAGLGPVVFRLAGLILALIGLGPLVWAGLTNGQLGVLRLAVLDPILLIAACAIAASMAPDKVRTALAMARDWLLRPSDRAFSLALFSWVLALSTAFAWYCFGGQVVSTDELTQAFQGRLLLAGGFAAHGEPLRQFFETGQTVRVGDRWFGEFPIGAGVLSAIGEVSRLPFLIYPLIAAAAAVGLYRFALRAYGRTTARLAGLLYALSPFVLFMGASRMNHTATLGGFVLALAALARWAEPNDDRVRHLAAAMIGVGIGIMTLFRPYDAVLIAIPIGLFQLWLIFESRSRARSLPTQILAAVLVTGIQLLVNFKTTGHAFEFGYDALNGPEHRPGFHTDPIGREFTPKQGAYWIGIYLIRLNSTLFETAIPAMAFIAGALLVVRRISRWDWLMLGILASTLTGYWAYWYDGTFVGPRFLFVAVPAFVVLTARFVAGVWERGDSLARRTALLVLPVSLLLAWLPIATTSRSAGVWMRARANRTSVQPWNPGVEAAVRATALTNALVFVREPLHRQLSARLRALGMRPYAAEQQVAYFDACALIDGLNAADSMASTPAADRLAMVLDRARAAGPAQLLPGFVGGRSLALAGGRASSESCAREIAADDSKVTSFEVFLANARFDTYGRLDGPVVFARDLGAQNVMLRTRFGDRTWYRYRRDSSAAGLRATFVPY